MINKSDMLQDIERVLVSEEEIHARIKEVGAQIADDYRGKSQGRRSVFRGNGECHQHSRAGGFHVHHIL